MAISRRDVIRRAAAGGALVWTAPAVRSLALADPVGSPDACVVVVLGVKYDVGDGIWSPLGPNDCLAPLEDECRAAAEHVAALFPVPNVVYENGSTTSARAVVVTLPPGIEEVEAAAKHGTKTGCRPADEITDEGVLFEQSGSVRNAISHVELLVRACVPVTVLDGCA